MKFTIPKASIAALAFTLGPQQVFGVKYRGTITVENMAPANATCITPPWVGIHAGTFDTYNGDEPVPDFIEPLAEDGNNAPTIAAFAETDGTVWDGTVGLAPICYAEKATLDFEFEAVEGAIHYFSYASMILPSNDAWVSNGNPEAFTIVDADGMFVPVEFMVLGSDVLDAGTEMNDELPENTAFFGQMNPNTGDDENGVVIDHPGFNPVGSGGILDDPSFANGDFTADGYEVMKVTVEASKVEKLSGNVVLTNKAPANGTCLTPAWVGIHAGTFDTYDRDAAASEELERLAEDGNNEPIIALFASTNGTVWDGTVGMAPICPGESATLPFSFEPVAGVTHYFSYASMILPSNDAFVSNGNPEAHVVVDEAGMFVPVAVMIAGSDVLDAGTEENDELPENTAFFGQMTPNTGVDENGVVVEHPGFNPVGSGGILDDPRFANGDFKADGYEVLTLDVTMGGDATGPPSTTPPPSMATPPSATPPPSTGPPTQTSAAMQPLASKVLAGLGFLAIGSIVF